MSTTPEYDPEGRPISSSAQTAGAGEPTSTSVQPSEAPTQQIPSDRVSPHVTAPQARAPHGSPHEGEAAGHAPTYPSASDQQHAGAYRFNAMPTGAPVPGGFGGGAPGGPGELGDHRVVEESGTSKDAKGRSGMLLAGLAVGALLGGVVGGGVAAVVSANAPQTSSTSAAGSSAITLNNAENATAISGVAAVATPSVVTLEVAGGTSSGSGSGVIYSEDGYIITNAHVVTLDGASMNDAAIRVKLSDGRIFDGDLVGVDPYADLAVVKVDATGLPAVAVADSDKLDVGDLTVAIGAPLNLANTVTSGVVSALNRGISVGSPLIEEQPSPDDGGGDDGSGGGLPWDFRFGLPDDEGQQQQQQPSSSGTVTLPVIQTDASINPGNSGGALLNGKGELIGINVAIASTSTTGGTAGSVGLGFAIPANLASRVADSIIAGEQPSHGLLGASVADSSQDTDADVNYAGGLLVEVVPDGAAAKAGLKPGDVITAVDGVSAVDGTSVSALIRMHAGDSTVRIEYMRNGEAAETEVSLGTLEW